ncbi:MAG: hypothetical protein ACRC10_11695 [Thermoguttaceae bacterium]
MKKLYLLLLLSSLFVLVSLNSVDKVVAATPKKTSGSKSASANKPVGIVAIKDFKTLLKMLGLALESVGKQDLMVTAQFFLGNLKGIDQKRPWGTMYYMVKGEPVEVFFAPFTNVEAATPLFGMLIKPTERPGVYSAGPMLFEQRGDWIFGSKTGTLPPGDLGKPLEKFALDVDMLARLLPEDLSTSELEKLMTLVLGGGPSSETESANPLLGLNSLLYPALSDLQLIDVRIQVDSPKVLNVTINAKTGAESEYTGLFEQAKNAKTRFAGIDKDPGVFRRFNLASVPINESLQKELASLIQWRIEGIQADLKKQGLKKDQLSVVTQCLNQFQNALITTVKQPFIDVAMLESDKGVGVWAFATKEGEKIGAALAELEQELNVSKTVEPIEGFNCTVLEMNWDPELIPTDSTSFIPKGPIQIIIATGPDSVYLAFGNPEQVETVLKKLIDNCRTPGPAPSELYFYSAYDWVTYMEKGGIAAYPLEWEQTRTLATLLGSSDDSRVKVNLTFEGDTATINARIGYKVFILSMVQQVESGTGGLQMLQEIGLPGGGGGF